MAKRKRSSEIRLHPRTTSKHERDAREVANARRLDKLPPELWDMIFDHLESDDLFPLALSCRYFRQKQKELVERTRQNGPGSGKPRLALKTDLPRKLNSGQLATISYLRFCNKEKVLQTVSTTLGFYTSIRSLKDGEHAKAKRIRYLAAYHGYLPLLQELQAGLESLESGITMRAGESSSPQSLLFLCFDF